MVRLISLLAITLLVAGCATTRQVATYNNMGWVNDWPGDPQDAEEKVILIAIDGTGNQFISRTNAARIFEMVDNRGPRADGRKVLTYYAEGVGADGGVLGLGLGVGMSEDIRQAYRFLLETWREGDEIHLTGFSRGAYGVRVLGGLVALAGIPDVSALSHDDRLRLVRAIHQIYKSKRPSGLTVIEHNLRRHRLIRELYDRFPDAKPRGDYFRIPIKTMAIWDTVAAMGIPDGTENPVEEELRYLLTNCNVENVYQALALDDNRAYSWTPLFVDGDAGFRSCRRSGETKKKQYEPSFADHLQKYGVENAIPQSKNVELEEVWFSGAHADVGGAYAKQDRLDGFLPGVSLNWMVEMLRPHNILPAEAGAFADEFGPIHDAKGYSLVYKPVYRRFRLPMTYHAKAFPPTKEQEASGLKYSRPLKIHHSAIKRYEYLRYLDNRFARCPEAVDTSYPKDERFRPKLPDDKPRLLCSTNLQSVGLLHETAFPLSSSGKFSRCFEQTADGFRLIEGQQCFDVRYGRKQLDEEKAR